MKFRTLAITAALALAGSAFAQTTTEITKTLPDGTVRHIVKTDEGLHTGEIRNSELRRGEFRNGDLRPGHRIVRRTVVYRDGYRHDRGYMRHHRRHDQRRVILVHPS
jgi:hypothetical protein